ncbi:TPA: hypothetical protein DEO28_00520 [Candidatus Dependentiae bacterium]|nr:MAG: hypothetical protein UR14_C0001G0045 [candidate division TM6 bacterium GW2011_GWE2_31_21]KKP54075.1 MAG: hypothetical protein UR43_C0001G0093 [candidate division TM6 bacterium GW2011_GWF2_33_332]HBS48343.1 hypothetical protein [Candidatus Dependentiae bacterium]HBZ72983.1 hypothetical protein [Candidatus Dependentiae bacterium]
MMKNESNKQILFIVYDGIHNSVFQSQVIDPILKRLHQNPNLKITLLSFEKKIPTENELLKINKLHPNLNLIIKKRFPFIGKISFFLPIKNLCIFLKQNYFDEIIARGPLAGYVAIKTMQKINKYNLKLTVQARGLGAEEYRFSNEYSPSQNILKKLMFRIIYKKLKNLEFATYCRKDYLSKFEIESVSEALKEYLITEFKADKNKITIAALDIPQKLSTVEIKTYRQAIRSELQIPQEAAVYCYSGSARPWQCIEESIEYFKKEHEKNKNIFLLIYSQDEETIKKIARQKGLDNSCYKIKFIKSQDLIRYLSAADFGILFRKKDIINYVSRPTKLLEYNSAGLKIIHNQTVALLK